ncbi:hypothetical protein RclHR1_04200016 [Rhizophagus clarus]|uniref:Protein kinase domain-containing protein n=1 Tax=Rhizophagus clarus TaxID=94130 RepID=A0A2Z6RFP6_9GLOM|nr:hypothetical protein RclHR1_04200016 [Rhizophagus clarus]
MSSKSNSLNKKESKCEKCDNKYTNKKYKWCLPCERNYFLNNFTNWTSGNEKIDLFIQEMQLKIEKWEDIIFEWIPYDQFNDVKEISRNNFNIIYSAIWKNSNYMVMRYLTTNSNMEVNEYSINKNILKIYGISQNPETKNYFMVLQDGFCEKCGELYTNIKYKWCKSCQIDELKKNLVNWNGNKKIDDFIKEMQSRISKWSDIVFEWIPYDHFIGVKKIGEGGFATVYSAIWKDGPLKYNMYKKKYERVHLEMKKFALKALNGSHNITDSFLNEVKAYSISTNMFDSNILKIYGISQNPVTKDYIIILDHAEGGSFNDWIKVKYNNYINWKNKLHILHNIISGLKEIHENKLIHRDFHTGNILFDYPKYKKDIRVCISDMGLCGEVNNVDETKIYGVLPYVAPEVLRGKPYTQMNWKHQIILLT